MVYSTELLENRSNCFRRNHHGVSTPTPNVTPAFIAAGPDGALWFADASAAIIGRITTAGQITEFRLRNPSARLVGIVAGPDGAMWFTERQNIVGRIDAISGEITEFVVPTDTQGAFFEGRIALGSDGAI